MKDRSLARKLATPLIIMGAFWVLAITLTLSTGNIFPLLNFGYIGTAIGIGMGLYALLPRPRKIIGRKLTQFLVGVYMLGFLGLLGRENMQIEGFFFYLLAGFIAGAVMHYLVAKIFGPLLFGRGWCGWSCWTAMVLDLLPFTRSPGRLPGRWGHLRYLHFLGSLGLVAGLWFLTGYRVTMASAAELGWLLAGNVLYFASGIGLAFALRDNRAFCKYLCPIIVPLKAASRFSLIKIGGTREDCNACGTCMDSCPMDIDIPGYIRDRGRVLSTECIFCQTCVNSCPKGVLRITFGLDTGYKERLIRRE